MIAEINELSTEQSLIILIQIIQFITNSTQFAFSNVCMCGLEVSPIIRHHSVLDLER